MIDEKQLNNYLIANYCYGDKCSSKCSDCNIGIDIHNICNSSTWINCNEFRPKIGQEVLVSLGNQVVIATYGENGFYAFSKWLDCEKPTFWMPKPLPYTET